MLENSAESGLRSANLSREPPKMMDFGSDIFAVEALGPEFVTKVGGTQLTARTQ